MKARQLLDKFLENWPVKVVCFIMALFLYIFNQQSSMAKRTFNTDIEIESESGFLPAEAYTKDVAINLRGKAEEINSLKDYDVKAYIDLSYVAEAGKYEFPVLLRLSENVTSLNPMEIKVSPEKITLRVEEEAAGYATVNPLLKGNPAHGYYVKSITVNPEQVKIRGAKSHVQSFKSIQTETVVLNNAQTSFTKSVKPDNRRRNIIVDDNNVEVTVEIEEQRSNLQLSDVALNFSGINPKFDFESSVKIISFSVEGTVLDIEKLTDKGNITKIDCSDISEPGNYEKRIEYNLPAGVSIVGNYPRTCHIDVYLKSNEEKISVVETPTGSLEDKPVSGN